MKNKLLFVAFVMLIIVSCNNNQNKNTESPEINAEADEHDHEDVKISITAYNNEFEVFAEADAFVAGKKSNVLSHLTHLSDFSPLQAGVVTIRLIIDDKEISQTLEEPTKKGIYSFNIQPETSGSGQLIYDIQTETGDFQLKSDVIIYATEKEADEASEAAVPSKTNTTVFTKEQSWKVDFATELPQFEPFGQVIKTTAQIQSAQSDEIVLTAKTNGIVALSGSRILEGNAISKGQVLFSISGNELADNNSNVRFLEAKNNFEKATADYERSKELAKDKIVSEKDLLNRKMEYENTKAIYENLNKNFNASGQMVSSPMSGFVKRLFVQNGQFVESGQPIATVSQNKTLLLHAEVQQKYSALMANVQSANINDLSNNKSYSLEELNGKIISYGKNTNNGNFMIPVNLQIDNNGSFVPGSFVEIYLKAVSSLKALTIPNSALMEEQGIFFVFVQVTPELFEKREVKTGVTDGIKTEILSGLKTGDRIVSKGAILIKLSQSTGALDAHSGHVH